MVDDERMRWCGHMTQAARMNAVFGTDTKSLMASNVSIKRSGRHRSRSSTSTTRERKSVSPNIFSESSRNFRTSRTSGLPG